MQKLLSFLALQVIATFYILAQPVSEYSYKLANGITVRTERCWNHVWIQQDFAAMTAGEQTPLGVSTRILGDLTSGSSFKLLREGKEVKMQGAAPGTYDLKLTFNLAEKAGTLSFIVENVIIKPKTKTTVSITLYDYQISIAESPASLKGLSFFDSKINRFKGNAEQSKNVGIPAFYAKGTHEKLISPDETVTNTSVKIKPGTYDVLISMGICGQMQKVWLENFTLKPDMNYLISTNLNGGVIAYSGVNKDVKKIHLYPAGTAATQTGAPSPVRNLELGSFDGNVASNACAPGSYDVLLAYGSGNKYEWKKNLVVKTGSRTDIR